MMEKKNAKDIFGETEKKVDKITELPQAVKVYTMCFVIPCGMDMIGINGFSMSCIEGSCVMS